MRRRPLTSRVPRTRAGGTWTEASMWSFIRSGIRQLSRRWPPLSDVIKLHRRPYHGPNKRRKWEVMCAACGHWYAQDEVEVDHIVPCGSLKSFADISGFCERLFVEADGLQVLCESCHEKQTAAERAARESR